MAWRQHGSSSQGRQSRVVRWWVIYTAVTTGALSLGCVPPTTYQTQGTYKSMDPLCVTPLIPKRLADSGWQQIRNVRLCAVKTQAVFPSARGFLYNSQSDLCTPVLSLVAVGDQDAFEATPEEGKLYWDKCYCPEEFGMFHIESEDIPVCLYQSSNTATYEEAVELCRASGGNLTTAKTVARLNFLKSFTDVVAWIGLDDLEQEGVYRWQVDGEVMDSEQIDVLFRAGQPDNHKGNEHCCTFEIQNLNDAKCSHLNAFICEYPFPGVNC